jgi:hypothetical protein
MHHFLPMNKEHAIVTELKPPYIASSNQSRGL